jgi:hypothetical protein
MYAKSGQKKNRKQFKNHMIMINPKFLYDALKIYCDKNRTTPHPLRFSDHKIFQLGFFTNDSQAAPQLGYTASRN